MNKTVKLDAQETIYFTQQLELVKNKVYEKKYPELKARTLIPVSPDSDPAADSISYYMYDMVGMAMIVHSYAKDFPRAGIKKQKFSSPVVSLGDSYGYSVQDIRKAQKTGTALDQREANAAKKAMLLKEEDLSLFGDTMTGLKGFFNHPNLPEVVLPADGTGSSKAWSTKSPDQILRDLNLMANAPFISTKGVETPDTLVLPLDQFTLVSTTKLSANSDTTILEFFLSKTPFIKNVDTHYRLDGAGAGATDRAIVYKRDLDAISLEIPQDFEQFPAQEEGMEFVVYCHERFGGVIFHAPLSAAFADGI